MSFRLNVRSVKCSFGQMSVRPQLRPLAKCPFDLVSVRSSVVRISVKCLYVGCITPSIRLVKCPFGKLSVVQMSVTLPSDHEDNYVTTILHKIEFNEIYKYLIWYPIIHFKCMHYNNFFFF